MWNSIRQKFFPPRKAPTPQLLIQSRSPDGEVRKSSVAGLAATEEPWAATALLNLLGDHFSSVRDEVLRCLRDRGVAAESILIVGLDHGQADVAKSAAELLGEVGTVEAAGPLLKALKYAQRPVQIAAKRALIKIGMPVMPTLMAAGAETHPWVRQQIDEIVASIPDEANQLAPSPETSSIVPVDSTDEKSKQTISE